jgi:ABC-2 type transport system permease protein
MKKLLAAEWYKLRNGKLFLIILAGAAVQIFLGMQRVRDPSLTPTPGAEAVALFGEISWVFCFWFASFAAFFIAQEFPHGTIRNTLALGKKRTSVYLSKLIFMCLITIPLLAAVSIAAVAGCTFAAGFGDTALTDFIKIWAAHFSIQIIFHLLYAALFTMIAVVCRNPALTIIFGLAYIFASGALMGALPETLSFLKVLSVEYYISNLKDTIGINNVNSISTNIAFILQGAAVSLCYFALFTGAGCLLFKKSDVK